MKYSGFKKWGVREDSNRRKGITHVKPLFWILAAIRLPSRTFLILHFESDLQKDSSKYQFSGNWVFEFLKIQIFEQKLQVLMELFQTTDTVLIHH